MLWSSAWVIALGRAEGQHPWEPRCWKLQAVLPPAQCSPRLVLETPQRFYSQSLPGPGALNGLLSLHQSPQSSPFLFQRSQLHPVERVIGKGTSLSQYTRTFRPQRPVLSLREPRTWGQKSWISVGRRKDDSLPPCYISWPRKRQGRNF